MSDVSLTGDGEQVDDAQGPPPPPQTPSLTIKTSGLSMEEDECLCSLGCTGVHTQQVGTKLSDECTSVQWEHTDMRNVLPVNKYIHTSIKKTHVKTPATPGLSSELASMNIEEDGCICSIQCVGHDEDDEESDECVCTVTCKGVQTHILTRRSIRDEEYNMGIKYCLGTEQFLHIYNHIAYNPSTSAGKFTIYTHSTSATGGEDGREEEAVGGEEESHTEDEMGRVRSIREEDTFQKIDMTSLISDWEKRAGGRERREDSKKIW